MEKYSYEQEREKAEIFPGLVQKIPDPFHKEIVLPTEKTAYSQQLLRKQVSG